MERSYAMLADRGILAVGGADARAFLQGLISNDVRKVDGARAIYAGLLTAQGKFLHDFFVFEHDGVLHLDCEGRRLADLQRRLALYRLRAAVDLDDVSDRFAIAACIGHGTPEALRLPDTAGAATALRGGVVFVDPRLAALGVRAVLPRGGAEALLGDAGFAAATGGAYEALRMTLGVADGSRDMEVEKAIPLENGFDELNGVDFDKGCYVGQELTARTKHRALIRKRLVPVAIDGPTPDPGTPVMLGGRRAGEMRSGMAALGLALMRLDLMDEAEREGAPLTADAARIHPRKPDWINL